MKRTLRNIVLIAAVILFTMQSYHVVLAQGMRDEVKINMKVEVGFDGYYKLGSYVPFYFEIENKLKDINGELQVELPDDMNNLTLYAMQINLPNNSTKKFMMNIPINRFTSKLQVNIMEGKNKVFTQSIKVSPGANIETFGLGILSDDYESVKYINKIPNGNYTQFSTKTVKLSEKMLSDSVDILKNFNVIVINNFDTSKLTKEQYGALKAWVTDGGVLIIGTGPSHSKTLAVFKDDFISGEIGDVSTIATRQLYSVAQGGASGESMTLSALNLKLKDSSPVVAEGSTPLVVKMEKGSGIVAVAAFDFGLEPLSSWVGRSSFSEKLLQKLMPGSYSNPYFSKDIYMMNNMYAIDNSLRNIPELPKTDTRDLVVVLLVYIVLVGPLSYLVLKKLDRRELMWLTVPAMALIFAFIIYMTGFGTRMTEPIVNVINIVEFGKNGNAVPKSFAGVFTPNKSNVRVEAAEGVNIKPIVMNVYDHMGPMNPNEKQEKQVISKVTVSPKTVVEFYRTSVWSMKTLIVNNNENMNGKFDIKINHSKSAYQGSIINNSGFDLQECYIATSNQVINIGPIKNGETIEVKDLKGKYYAYPYEMINAIYQDPYQGRKPGQRFTQQEMDEFRKNFQKRQVMEYYLMGGGQGIKGAKLIGWSNTPVIEDILVNGKTTDKYEKNLVVSDVEITFRTGNRVSYPTGYIQPSITKNTLTNGSYDEYGKMFYGRGDVEITFSIDKNIELDYVKLQYTAQSHGGQSQIKQFIWNHAKKNWEEGSYGAFYMDAERIAKYVDKNNQVRLKFEMYDGNLQLPQISVEGSVK